MASVRPAWNEETDCKRDPDHVSTNSNSSKHSGGAGAQQPMVKKQAKPKGSFLSRLLPNLRFLEHLRHNPCNSDVHERDKWLLACLTSRGTEDKKQALYERVSTLLDTQALVCTFIAGFSFLVISDDIKFDDERIPLTAIVALLGFAFVLSVATTLVSVTIKTHLVEIGYEQVYTFFAKYAWLMSLLAHLIIQSITAFMGSGLMIMFNKFGLYTGIAMLGVVGALFIFLALLNLELRDRSMAVLGFQFVNGQYTLPVDVPVWSHDEGLAEQYSKNPTVGADSNTTMFLSKSFIKSAEVEQLQDEIV